MNLPQKRIYKELKLHGKNLFKREIGIDNVLLDTLFSSSEEVTELKEFNFEDSKKLDEIFYIINNMLPDIEKQIIFLLFFLKKNQETVGRLLHISQEMAYYYKKRALARIKVHYFFRSVDMEKMDAFLKKHVTKKQHIAMLEYFKEHDLRKIAKKISVIENRKDIHYEAIGSRIKLGLKRIKSLTTSFEPELKKDALFFYEIFKILKSYNSLHHTQSKKQINQEILA